MDLEESAPWLDLETVDGSVSTHLEDLELPGLTILAHPDASRVGERLALPQLTAKQRTAKGEVLLSRAAPLFLPPEATRGGRPLADPRVSRDPVRLSAVGGGVRLDASGTSTRVEADGEEVDGVRDLSVAEVERGVVLLLARRVAVLLHLVSALPPLDLPGLGLVGESQAIAAVRREIRHVAELDVTVLIRGETGTGKELVARAVHQASGRRSRPFVIVHLGGVASGGAAAELFGTEAGAAGCFAEARGGTLFLDEVGEAAPEVQRVLLSALDAASKTSRDGDVRVLAAATDDLLAASEAERFRAPLFHRLSGYDILLPPLRERRDDVGRLLVHFLQQELDLRGESWPLFRREVDTPWLGAPLVARLAAYDWPGNVRQLHNVARQILIGNRGAVQLRMVPRVEELLGEEAPSAPPEDEGAPAIEPPPEEGAPYRAPAEVGEEELLRILKDHAFRLQPAAAALGVSRTSLYALIEKSPRIRKARDLTREEIEASRKRHRDDLDAMAGELEVSRKGLRRRMTQLGLH